jgi:hypothetical protein
LTISRPRRIFRQSPVHLPSPGLVLAFLAGALVIGGVALAMRPWRTTETAVSRPQPAGSR